MIVSEERQQNKRLIPIRCRCGAEFGTTTPKDKKEIVREIVCEKCKYGSFEKFMVMHQAGMGKS